MHCMWKIAYAHSNAFFCAYVTFLHQAPGIYLLIFLSSEQTGSPHSPQSIHS